MHRISYDCINILFQCEAPLRRPLGRPPIINTAISQPPKRRQRAGTEEVRQKILQAAAALFGQRGYDATGIREIEDAARVSRGVVTYHLGNKEDIWKEAILFTFAPFLREIGSTRQFLKTLDPQFRTRHIIAQFIRTSARNPHMNRIMIQEGFERTWRSEFIIESFLKPFRTLSREIGAGDTMMKLVDGDPHVRYALLGACNMVFSLPTEVEMLFGQNVYDDAFIDRHIDTVISIVESFASRHTGSGEGK